MTVDVRTRTDHPRDLVDAATFFETDLPRALSRWADNVAPAIAHLQPDPLAVEIEGCSWTLDGRAEGIVVHRGSLDGAKTLELTQDQLADLVEDLVTPMGWFASGALRGSARLESLLDWWLLIRGALDGTVVHSEGAVTFVAPDGEPLDLGRIFRLSDDPAEMRWFLEQAGYLHVAGVFSEEEMAAVSADMDQAMAGYSPGDGHSWWAKTEDGTDRLVRMQQFDERSDTVAALTADQRLRQFGDLTGDGHHWGDHGSNRIEALIKPIGIVEGISDVPWHKDCSLGRHSYECSSLTLGISVSGADAKSGQLRVVAGSHRALIWPALIRKDLDLPMVDLPTATGDATIHLSCTLHMAQPPTEQERRVMYTSFWLPSGQPGAEQAAQNRITEIREKAAITVSQPASHVMS